MQILRITGFTRELGKSQGYMGLPVRDIIVHNKATGQPSPAMETAWELAPDEIQSLINGEPIVLRVLGQQHPPVSLSIGDWYKTELIKQGKYDV